LTILYLGKYLHGRRRNAGEIAAWDAA
jgi:hypothetical protein